MVEIFYCKNENDMKKACLHIFRFFATNVSLDYAIQKSNISCCDILSNDLEFCDQCKNDGCILFDHLEDKNIHNHINVVFSTEIEYPCIVCLATEEDCEDVTIYSVNQAKYNTKYGIHN